jgi:hypothetical protein
VEPESIVVVIDELFQKGVQRVDVFIVVGINFFTLSVLIKRSQKALS